MFIKIRVCCVFLLFTLVVKAQQFAVHPTILEFNLPRGSIKTQVVQITNTSNKRQIYEISLGDWYRDSLGNHHYFRPDTLPRSCAGWISLGNNFVELPPNGVGTFLLTIKAPSDTAHYNGTRWAMLFVQTVPENTNLGRTGKNLRTMVVEIFRIGIHIYQTPPDLIDKEAKALSLVEDSTQQNTWIFSVANTGPTMLNCSAHLELTEVASGKTIKTDPVEFPLFPDGKRKLSIALPSGLEKGKKYSLLGILDYDPDKPLEAIEKNFEAK